MSEGNHFPKKACRIPMHLPYPEVDHHFARDRHNEKRWQSFKTHSSRCLLSRIPRWITLPWLWIYNNSALKHELLETSWVSCIRIFAAEKMDYPTPCYSLYNYSFRPHPTMTFPFLSRVTALRLVRLRRMRWYFSVTFFFNWNFKK